AHTNLNLVLGVDFNQSVAKSAALYWSKQKGQLAELINQVDAGFDSDHLGKEAKAIIQEHYTWEKIVGEYEALFLNEH
ncbi:TPA: glycosyl transferase, partial [Streptococcus pyogenes]|nr:glycosyl transferase [Streptococcus pyogenes]